MDIIWTGPYELWRLYENGSANLRDLEGRELPERVNRSKLKKYQAQKSDEFWATELKQGPATRSDVEEGPDQEKGPDSQEPQLQWLFTQEGKDTTAVREKEVSLVGKVGSRRRNEPRRQIGRASCRERVYVLV